MPPAALSYSWLETDLTVTGVLEKAVELLAPPINPFNWVYQSMFENFPQRRNAIVRCA